MQFESVHIENPKRLNLILGQSHFIKSCEDLYETIYQSNPAAKFGLAFNEASCDRLIRIEGNDRELMVLAEKNAAALACGHTFIIFMGEGFYPVSVLNAVKNIPEVCHIFCATANDVRVVVCEIGNGRGVMGVVDGESPLGTEDEQKRGERRDLLRKLGYKK